MKSPTLERLYQVTLELLGGKPTAFAGVEWIERVPPHITDACRDAVASSSHKAFSLWRSWIDEGGFGRFRSAEDPAAIHWRASWIALLIDLGAALARDDAARDAPLRAVIAADLARTTPPPFHELPREFWTDLVEGLCVSDETADASHRPSRSGAVKTIAFPLVLAQRMVIGGEAVGVIVAEYRFEKTGAGTNAIYPDPRQIAIRCQSPSFLETYRSSAAVHERLSPGNAGAVRVGIRARSPEHEGLLQKLVLSGPSGGGALAAGVHFLLENRPWPDSATAVSFALTAPGASEPDGLCHPVGGAHEKVQGCAKNAVRRLLVSADQAGEAAFYGGLQEVRVCEADAISDALAILAPETAPEASGVGGAHAPDDGGVMPLDSPLYIVRGSDEAFEAALRRRPMIVLVKGARQIGKTSLLVRGADQVRRARVRSVYVDLQSLGRGVLHTQRELFSALARIFARELDLNVSMDDLYDERDGPNKNFENFLFQYALDSPVVWFMDEVDRLFDYEFCTDIFGLMRSWHNRRPVQPELANLTLVLAYATETHLLIEDPYQSPFNVGVRVEMRDFTPEQIAGLNERLGRPLRSDIELETFHALVGGHPYLTCRGLTWMVEENARLDDFAARASLDHGPFGDHLRRLRLIAQNEDHAGAAREALRGSPNIEGDSFLHLRSAGVLTGDSSRAARMRCRIYEDYLREYLQTGDPITRTVQRRKAPFLLRVLGRDKS